MDSLGNISSFEEYHYTINIIKVPHYFGYQDSLETEDSFEDPEAIENNFTNEVIRRNNTSLKKFNGSDDGGDKYFSCFNGSSSVERSLNNILLNASYFSNGANCSNFNLTEEEVLDIHEKDSRGVLNWWWGFVAILIVLVTTLGNILVILAISWDRRLQNMTNYFLLSLAATDLMVAIFVMPVGIVVLFLGRFPFSSEFCLLWISLDVLFCSASIMHLCTISVDRYLSLSFPMKFGRYKTRKRVFLKLAFVWCLSLATSMPVSLMYAANTKSTIVNGVCQIPVSLFQIIGSLFAFYIPLIIMLVTYALTVKLLSKKESELNAMSLETPVTPLSHSVRLKSLLCKTTSTISSTTATSIADTELSETAQSEELDSEANNSPNKRVRYPKYTSNFRCSGQRQGRSFAIREKGGPTGEERSRRIDFHDCHLRPPTSSSSAAAPNDGYSSHKNHHRLPKKQYKPNLLLLTNGNKRDTKSSSKVQKAEPEVVMSKLVEIRISESTPVESPSVNHDDVDDNDDDDEDEDEDDSECVNGTSVPVPCSCAPRFFLEGITSSRNNPPSESSCLECAQGDGESSTRVHNDDDQRKQPTSSSRPFATFSSHLLSCFQRKVETGEAVLDSPWHEEDRASPRPSETLVRPDFRPSVFQRSTTKSSVSSISPSFPRSAPAASAASSSSSSSNSRAWRTRSSTASMKYASSKRHGRNLRMEQKATKVLGIVFFTFVILWAPFFIINILLGACPTCIHAFSDDVINFVTWLGYVSSTVNPFFYTFFNKSFRDAFLKILKCNIRHKRKYNF